MNLKFKHQLKSFFTFTKSEQRGVAVLLVLIFIVLIINISLPLFFREPETDFSRFNAEVEKFIAETKKAEDSIRIENLQNSGDIDEELARKKLKPFPFDPNKLPEEKWLEMGLTRKQVKSILKYEAKGGRFYKKEDLKKLWAISDVEYNILAPYIKITGDFVTETEKPKRIRPSVKTRLSYTSKKIKTEINSADSAMFVKQLGLSPWLAARIVKYRKLLGGFYTKSQLKEVYGMKKDIYNAIEPWLTVDSSKVVRIDINRAGFKEIIRHPYIDYQTTKKLVKGRNRGEGYKTLADIKRVTGLPDSIINRIKHYLYLRPLKNYRDE